MSSLVITIHVTGGVPTAIIDDGANRRVVRGVALFGADSNTGELYTFCWGSPTEAAQAVGEGVSRATNNGDPWYIDFYKALTMQLAMRTRTRPNECRIAPEELEERWKTNEANPESPAVSDCECEIGHCDHVGSRKNPNTPRGKKVAYVGAEGIVEGEPDDTKWN